MVSVIQRIAGGLSTGVSMIRRLFRKDVLQVSLSPELVMGTNTMLKVVVDPQNEAIAQQALGEAERTMRDLEHRLSRWLPDSDIARFNASPVGSIITVHDETRALLLRAQQAYETSKETFDCSSLPLVQLWERSAKEDREPTDDELKSVLEAIGWRGVELTDEGLRKTHPDAGIDLGGIGKGYGVDCAIQQIKALDVLGALVQCGGDTHVIGRSERDHHWRIGLHDPNAEDESSLPQTMFLRDASVSTSGDYERFVTIKSEQRSHILDPRTGQPISNVPQTTLIGTSAVETDVWSTTLSILGEAGLDLLPESMDAHIILRTEDSVRFRITDGFSSYLNPR